MSQVQKTKDGDFSPGCSSVQQERSDSPEPSCVSMKSDCSMDDDTRPNLSSVQQERSDSPEPSCVSMKSDCSMDPPPKLKGGDTRPNLSSVQQERSDSPEPSCVSMKSDCSMDPPPKLKGGDTRPNLSSVQQERSDSPEPSCVSMKSDCSMDPPPKLKGGETRPNLSSVQQERSDSPEPSCVSMKSDCSMDPPPKLKGGETRPNLSSVQQERSDSPEPSCVSMKSDCSMDDDTRPNLRRILRSRPDEIEPICKKMKYDEFMNQPPDFNESMGPGDSHEVLKTFRSNLMKRFQCLYEGTAKQGNPTLLNEIYTEFDGLDECRLSLDFQSNVRLFDVSESASVNVLLMNLIVGNLLPSALIWITSRPAAADLVPSECVHRVTEVRGFNEPQKEEYFKKRVSDQSLANTIISHLKSSRSLFIMCHIPVFCWISAAVLEKMLSRAESGEIPKTLTQMYTHFLILQTNIKHEKDYEKNVTDKDMILKLGKLAYKQLERGNLIFYEEDLRECGIDVTEASVYSGLCTQIFREEFGLYQGKVFCFVHLSVQEHLAALYVHLSYKNNRSQFLYDVSSELSEFFTYNLSDVHQRAVDKTLQSKNGHLDLFLRFFLGLSVKNNQILLQRLMKQIRSSSDSNEKTVEYIKMKIRTSRSPEKSINLFHCLNELGDHSLVKQIQHYLRSGKIKKVKLSSSQWSAVAFVLLTSEKDLDEFRLNEFVGAENKADHVLQKLVPVIKESRRAEFAVTNLKFSHKRMRACKCSSYVFEWEDLRECGIDVTEASVYSGLCTQIFREEFGLYQGKVFCFVHLSVQEHLAALYVHLSYKNNRSQFLYDVSSELSEFFTYNLSDVHQRAVDKTLQSKNGHLDLFLRFFLGLSVKNNQILLQRLMKQIRSSSDSNEKTVEYIKMKIRTSRSPEKSINLFHCLNELGDHSLVKQIQHYLRSGKIKKVKLSSSQWSAVAFVLLTSEKDLDEFRLNEFVGAENKADHVLQKLVPVIKESRRAELSDCGVTDEGCAALASALRSNSSHLRELDLSGNKLGDSGVMSLSSGLENPDCKLEILRLSGCGLADEGCGALTSALRSNPSHLRELDLSENILEDSGVMHLSSGFENPHCKLEILRLYNCGITDEGCAALASALKLNTSHLRELDLSDNELKDSGVGLLSSGLLNPDCKLEILRLVDCRFTDEGCAALASVLRSNPSNLRELDLSDNELEDSGVMHLSSGLENPDCKLEILRLRHCDVSKKGCTALASALRSNPSHLRVLELNVKKIRESGRELLTALLDSPHYKLESLLTVT
ncbi:uncharacterized protein [Sinocyclocheilus grahami]|uniref:uncharacterized protein n=1 Tax=Sinocyclocheilus grahami TaxID=75366 RepID=UPI0007AD18E0|nr:PREDICTED: uncharacterized protein LOC107558814 [Sinocyclocheilus grahami]